MFDKRGMDKKSLFRGGVRFIFSNVCVCVCLGRVKIFVASCVDSSPEIQNHPSDRASAGPSSVRCCLVPADAAASVFVVGCHDVRMLKPLPGDGSYQITHILRRRIILYSWKVALGLV